MQGKILSINIAAQKGVIKKPVASAMLTVAKGIEGDGHFGFMHRQVSLLPQECVDSMPKTHVELVPGIFAENITTEGIIWSSIPVGASVTIGGTVMRITQIGKECHARCAIYAAAGDCVMPREGVFAEVLVGGVISVGDNITVCGARSAAVLVTSDRCAAGVYEDTSGKYAAHVLCKHYEVVDYQVLPDAAAIIEQQLIKWCAAGNVDLVITSGGTGLAPRDVTVDATLAIVERQVPGIAEMLRANSMQVTPFAALSRATAGIRARTLIINLPGSEKAVREQLQWLLPLLPHAIRVISGEKLNCGNKYEN